VSGSLPCPPGQTPRAWQLRALDALRDAGWGPEPLRRVVITAATGTGKGTLLAGLAALVAARGWRVLALVHRDELIRDLAGRMSLVGLKVGIVKGPENGMLAPVVVASVQTLGRPRRLAQLGLFDLVITDECHHALAPTYRGVYGAVNAIRAKAGKGEALHVGFTATPFRSGPNGTVTGLSEVYQATIFEHGIVQAIDQGDLVPPVGVRIDTHVELSGLAVRGGDFAEEDLAKLIDHDERNAVVAKWYAENGGGRPFLAFGVSVAHAERLAEALRGERVAVEAVYGDLAKDERAARLARFRSGELLGLVSRDLLFEGFDAPKVSMLLCCRPTKSPIIAWQLVGRGLRLAPGKSDCLIVDFVRFLDSVDLSAVPSLGSAPEVEASKVLPAALRVGDRVQHRYDDLGRGQIVALVTEQIARVLWSEGQRVHGLAELERARADESAAVPLIVTGHTESLVHLLPGRSATAAWPWIELGTGAVDGRPSSRRWCVSAAGGEGRTVHAVVVEVAAGWVLWQVRRREVEGVVEQSATRHRDGPLPGLAGRLRHQRTAEAWLGETAGQPLDLTAGWRTAPATERQIGKLRGLGFRRDFEGLTGGEASALIGAAWGWAAVEAARRENRQRHGVARAGGGR
jgi:superfamily II DNA or RNA helicase